MEILGKTGQRAHVLSLVLAWTYMKHFINIINYFCGWVYFIQYRVGTFFKSGHITGRLLYLGSIPPTFVRYSAMGSGP